MRLAAIYSTLLHIAIVAMVYFGLPDLFEPDEAVNRPIPVAVYIVSDETTLPPATPEPEPEPAKEPPPPPEPVETAELPPAPEPIETPEPPPPPEPVVEKTPPPEPLPEPTPEPLPSPLKVAEPDPKNIPPPPPPKPVQVAKIENKPKPEPDPPDFSSLLVDLATKLRTEATPDQKAAEPKPNPETTLQVTASTRRASEVRNEPLSLSVIDAIRRQVENKWNPLIGALDAKELSVEIRIVLQTNGAVHDVQIVDKERLRQPGQENFRAFAESAERAVWRASPLQQLPPEKYDQWQQITLTFKPPV